MSGLKGMEKSQIWEKIINYAIGQLNKIRNHKDPLHGTNSPQMSSLASH